MGWASVYIKQLQEGREVKFRPNGGSMRPLIEPGQLCTLEPTTYYNRPMVGDIVLCTVRGQDYLHLVKTMRGDQLEIANNQGYINGWTSIDNVYGRLIQIEP